MLLLAASVLALGAPAFAAQEPVRHSYQVIWAQAAAARQVPNLSAGYQRFLPSLASVVVGGQADGMAVLIDTTGLYLASKMPGMLGEVELTFTDGHVGHATVLSQDGCTQMVLLRSDYVPTGANAITAAVTTPPGTSLIIVLRRGGISARVVSDSKLGVEKPSNRVVPLSEIRLELPEATLGGAPVFTSDGAFVGLLSGSLVHQEPAQPQRLGGFGGGGGGGAAGGTLNGPGGRGGLKFNNKISNVMGPADLTVGYLPAPDVVRLVLEGFESPSHVVDHPSLGVFCGDGAGGALIQEVVKDSAASHIGLKEGDMITMMGEYLVRDKSDFAKVMFKFRAGDKVSIRFDREGKTAVREATLGVSRD